MSASASARSSARQTLTSRANSPSGSSVTSRLQDQLQSVLLTLSEREADVVRLWFRADRRQPRTLDEIGQVYG